MWIGTLVALILFVPKYLPDGEVLLVSDFEKVTTNDSESNHIDPGPWHYSTNAIVWEEGTGLAESACIRLNALQKSPPYLEWNLVNPQRFSFLKFDGSMRTENIIEGEMDWNTARFIVFFKELL